MLSPFPGHAVSLRRWLFFLALPSAHQIPSKGFHWNSAGWRVLGLAECRGKGRCSTRQPATAAVDNAQQYSQQRGVSACRSGPMFLMLPQPRPHPLIVPCPDREMFISGFLFQAHSRSAMSAMRAACICCPALRTFSSCMKLLCGWGSPTPSHHLALEDEDVEQVI